MRRIEKSGEEIYDKLTIIWLADCVSTYLRNQSFVFNRKNNIINYSNPYKRRNLIFYMLVKERNRKENITEYLISNNNINLDFFKKFLKKIVDYEEILLNNRKKPSGDDIISRNSVGGTISLKSFRKEYIDNNFKTQDYKDLDSVCEQYVKSLTFCIQYYALGMPDWHYYYPFHYSLPFMDLYSYISKLTKIDVTFSGNYPLNIYDQLISILPPESVHLLPRNYHQLVLSPHSEIADFFPSSFYIDYDGKTQEYEGIVLLPFIELERLLNSTKDIICNDERNKPDNIHIINGKNE